MDREAIDALKNEFERWASENGFLTNDAEDLDMALQVYGEEKELSEEEWDALTSPSYS